MIHFDVNRRLASSFASLEPSAANRALKVEVYQNASISDKYWNNPKLRYQVQLLLL